jgi:tetratricopeptide (TPR) repeat protein
VTFTWSNKLIAITLVAVAAPALAAATKSSWTRLMVEGTRTHDVRLFLAAADLARQFGPHDPRLHIALRTAGLEIAHSVTDYSRAEPLFKQDIACLEYLDKDFPDIVPDLYDLAWIYLQESRYQEAEGTLLRAVQIRKKWDDMQSRDPFNAAIYAALYLTYTCQGKTLQATDADHQMRDSLKKLHSKISQAHCLYALQLIFDHFTEQHPELSATQAKQYILQAQVYSDEALTYWTRVCDVSNQMTLSANLAWKLGEKEKSDELLRRSLQLTEGDFKSNRALAHASVLILCEHAFAQKRGRDAEKLEARYLADVAKAFGSDTPDYASALEECAFMSKYAHLYERSKAQSKQAQLLLKRLAKQ